MCHWPPCFSAGTGPFLELIRQRKLSAAFSSAEFCGGVFGASTMCSHCWLWSICNGIRSHFGIRAWHVNICVCVRVPVCVLRATAQIMSKRLLQAFGKSVGMNRVCAIDVLIACVTASAGANDCCNILILDGARNHCTFCRICQVCGLAWLADGIPMIAIHQWQRATHRRIPVAVAQRVATIGVCVCRVTRGQFVKFTFCAAGVLFVAEGIWPTFPEQRHP